MIFSCEDETLHKMNIEYFKTEIQVRAKFLKDYGATLNKNIVKFLKVALENRESALAARQKTGAPCYQDIKERSNKEHAALQQLTPRELDIIEEITTSLRSKQYYQLSSQATQDHFKNLLLEIES